MQKSHPIKHLWMPASKTLLGTIYFPMNSTELKSNVNKTFIKLNWTLLAMCAVAD